MTGTEMCRDRNMTCENVRWSECERRVVCGAQFGVWVVKWLVNGSSLCDGIL